MTRAVLAMAAGVLLLLVLCATGAVADLWMSTPPDITAACSPPGANPQIMFVMEAEAEADLEYTVSDHDTWDPVQPLPPPMQDRPPYQVVDRTRCCSWAFVGVACMGDLAPEPVSAWQDSETYTVHLVSDNDDPEPRYACFTIGWEDEHAEPIGYPEGALHGSMDDQDLSFPKIFTVDP